MLIENFTATWCTYCPYQATAITQLEQLYGDSLTAIKYHPSQSDPFYHPHSLTRLYFYNVPGYPTSLIQGNRGVVGGWSGVYNVLKNYVDQAFQVSSPCSIWVNVDSLDAESLLATATVKVFMTSDTTIPIPSNLNLRIAVVEDSIMYQWQNMDVLRYVLREMKPDPQGIPLNLQHGDSLTYTFTFSIPIGGVHLTTMWWRLSSTGVWIAPLWSIMVTHSTPAMFCSLPRRG